MAEIVQFETDVGPVFVELDERDFGVERVARRDADEVIRSGVHLSEAFAGARPTIRALFEMMQELAPDEHSVEFGLKLNAEAGVIVAKTSLEGHFSVKMTWKRADAATP